MDRIQIKTDKENDSMFGPTRLLVNGREIKNFISAKYEISAESAPALYCEMVGMIDIDAFGCAVIDPSPQNLQEACRIITEELKKHGDFYEGFVTSVLSVIKPYSRYIGNGETEINCEYGENHLAEEIVKRIIGEE